MPPKPHRPLRKSLKHNTSSGVGTLDAIEAKCGYGIVGLKKLSVWTLDGHHLPISADSAVVTRTRGGETYASSKLNHEIIEDLFREAREGRFDAFSRRLKCVIQQYAAHIGSSEDNDTAARAGRPGADPLAAARQRRIDYALSEWHEPENLTLQAAARDAGISDNTINTRRQNQKVYALVAPNRSRGFRYPKWQFNVEPERLRLAMQTLTDADRNNCWALHSFFMTPAQALDDMRPCDYLTDPSKDIERLTQVLQLRFTISDQGAE